MIGIRHPENPIILKTLIQTIRPKADIALCRVIYWWKRLSAEPSRNHSSWDSL